MSEAEDDETPIWQSALKWGLIGVGGLVALNVFASLMGPIVVIAVLAAGGYFGAKWFKGQKALPSSSNKSLPMSNDEFEAKMRELDALEKRLDRDID